MFSYVYVLCVRVVGVCWWWCWRWWCGVGRGRRGWGGVESHRPYQTQHAPFNRDRMCDTTSPCGMSMCAQRITNATAQPASTTRRAVTPLVLQRQGRCSLRTAQHTSWASIAFPHYGTISKHALVAVAAAFLNRAYHILSDCVKASKRQYEKRRESEEKKGRTKKSGGARHQ